MRKLVLLTATTALLLASCSEASESDEAANDDESTQAADVAETSDDDVVIADEAEEEPDLAAQVPADWEAGVAASWAGANPDATQAQADCVGKAIVEQITIERLLEVGVRVDSIDEGMANAGFSEDETSTIDSIATECTA